MSDAEIRNYLNQNFSDLEKNVTEKEKQLKEILQNSNRPATYFPYKWQDLSQVVTKNSDIAHVIILDHFEKHAALSFGPPLTLVSKETQSESYYGEQTEDNLKYGRGIHINYDKKQLYKGEWKDNMKCGSGEMNYYLSECEYDGKWKDNMKCGHGTLKLKNGDEYTGDFKDDKYHGKGKYTWKNGDVYDGKFKEGRRTIGKMIFKATRPKGTYEGTFSGDLISGQGTFEYESGEVYSGEFVNGKRHGKGTMRYANGDKYEGMWENDEYSGDGVYFMKTERVAIKGNWAEGTIERNDKVIVYSKQTKPNSCCDCDYELCNTCCICSACDCSCSSCSCDCDCSSRGYYTSTGFKAVWVLQMIFCLLFTAFVIADFVLLPKRIHFATIVYAPQPSMYPLAVDSISFYIIMVIITGTIFLTFWFLLFKNKLSSEIDTMYEQTIGKLTIIPLAIAWIYTIYTFPIVLSPLGMGSTCLIFSLAGFVTTIVIDVLEDRVRVDKFVPFVVRKAFISCLMFLHLYVFTTSICFLAIVDSKQENGNKVRSDSQISIIFFTILFLGLWGGFRRDQVVNFISLLWIIGMMVNSARGKEVLTKKFRDGTLAITSLGLIAEVALMGAGQFLCKLDFNRQEQWPFG